MTCRICRELRDAFLDGELPQSQVAEMHAHLLQCPECQQHIELLRACGDVIRHDRRSPRLTVDFTDRLMATLPSYRVPLSFNQHRWMRARRWIEIGAIPAIAAALAFSVMLRNHAPTPPPANSVAVVPVAPEPRPVVAGDSAFFVNSDLNDAVSQIGSSLHQWGHAGTQINGFCLRTLEQANQSIDSTPEQPSFVSEVLHPLFDLFNPPIAPAPTSDDIQRL